MAKGFDYERECCKAISLWWSRGERDDLVWRTAGSGGRATNRAKQGKTTAGHYGDICATDPAVEPLFKAFAVEVKRGFNRTKTRHGGHLCLLDCVDRTAATAEPVLEQWVAQAEKARAAAKARSFLIAFRRDRRADMVVVEQWAWDRLVGRAGLGTAQLHLQQYDLLLIPRATFFARVTPAAIKDWVSGGRE
jgi:hypothetical protein